MEDYYLSGIKYYYEKVFCYPRVKKKQKKKAIEHIRCELKKAGYKFIESRDFNKEIKFFKKGANINIETVCDNPRYIISAHYDMPYMTYGRWLSYIMRGIEFTFTSRVFKILLGAITVFILIFMMLYSHMIEIAVYTLTGIFILYVFLCFIMSKISPFCSSDDNTSGVVAVLTIAEALKKNGIDNVKFIFFDNEEYRLSGSSAYVENHRPGSDVKVINLDCVGRGRNIYVQYEKAKLKSLHFLNDFLSFSGQKGINIRQTPTSSSDCRTFAKEGYEAFTIIRCDNTNFLGREIPDISWVHTKDDTLSKIDYEKINEVVNLVCDYIIKERS